MIGLAPQSTRDRLQRIMTECHLLDWQPSGVVQSYIRDIEAQSNSKIASTEKKKMPSQHLVPSVSFFENPDQAAVLRNLEKDLMVCQPPRYYFVCGMFLLSLQTFNRPLLLVGSQGVGKNRLIDHLLQRLNLPRQYMQLHRDVTVAVRIILLSSLFFL